MINKYNEWLNNAILDEDLIIELKEIKNDDEAIEERFYKELEFGTAGLRGIIGAGTNRMNVYTVMKATQGLANYLINNYENPSVAIAYDSRIKSKMFSEYAASVLAANNIKVYLYKELMPTPALSYAVRELKCEAGICVTASHNSSEYNGYKAYGSDGSQISGSIAKEITLEINKLNIFKDIKLIDFKEGLNKGIIEYISDDLIEQYINDISNLSLNKSLDNLKIVYTPLNGTGRKCVKMILEKQGFKDLNIVKEQEYPDGNFPTCKYPNPEKKEALKLGIDYAKEINADIVLATDPDADRVGVAIKHDNDYKLISGNEMGVLLFNYICENKNIPNKPVVVSTIVSTNMIKPIADKYNVEVRKTLTGFKYIGEQIQLLEQENRKEDYLFGFEESYGYLSGTHARDKDAINASMLICEMASYYKNQNMTLLDKLEQLYNEHGYYINKLVDFTFQGTTGMSKMNNIMNLLRKNNISNINGLKVESIIDYNKKQESNVILPLANVIEYKLENNIRFIARPSGTEPKIKFYIESVGTSREESLENINKIENYINSIIL